MKKKLFFVYCLKIKNIMDTKKIILLLMGIALSANVVIAQISESGEPLSKTMLTQKGLSTKTNTYKTKALNVRKMLRQDQKAKKGTALRYAMLEDVNIDLKEKGTKYKVNNGNIWIYRISSKNALSISLIFNHYEVPKGATLFLYNADYSQIKGAYTHKNNKDYKLFAIGDLIGNELILEYFEPTNAEFKGTLVIGKIGQAYRNIFENTKKSSKSGDFININCPEGDQLQLEKHSVGQMTFSGFVCTGSLINNTKNDGKNYFLTANHCISDNKTAKTLVTKFNYEYKDCADHSDSPLELSLSGATFQTTHSGSDVTLLLLDEVPKPNYQPYYAGWNAASDDFVISGSGVHHPEGKPKKVSITYDSILNWGYEVKWDKGESSTPNTHWFVLFSKGETAGGSSGSPLFDQNKRIIGQLHGGSDDYNYYGKLSTSWRFLKKFLDPDNSKKLVLDGYTPNTNEIDAFLYSDFTNVCAGSPVQLKNGSLFGAESWKWTISPNSYSFADGYSEISENPIVTFNEANKSYTLSLEAKKGNKVDIVKRNNYIGTGKFKMEVTQSKHYYLCHFDFRIAFFVKGVDSYEAKIDKASNIFEIDKDKSKDGYIAIRKKTGAKIDSTTVGELVVIGSLGECKDTVKREFKIFYQKNDDIKNAIALKMGNNGTFNNSCATAQENEPAPPYGEDKCTEQGYWCSCNVSDIPIINNSLWFTFQGPQTGVISVDCKGFDSQIAIYEAESAEDIMSGDKNKYKIIAANDDYSDKIMYPIIPKANVTPGKTYWLQVDGSACGAYGEFELTLGDSNLVGIKDKKISNFFDTKINLHPNPATTYFSIKMNKSIDNATIELIGIDGKKINSYSENIIAKNNYQFAIPKGISKGLYYVIVKYENNIVQKSKLLIK